ncbi:MAG: flaG [Caulobacteraceae bacterium]|nr:flaG [Caulobacteraceae bacterium]
MSNTVTRTGPLTEPAVETVRPVTNEVTPARKSSLSNPSDQNQYRLVIEEDQASGAFVYKTLDRDTGEVVLQYPREEVLRLKEHADYQAGAIIRTTA